MKNIKLLERILKQRFRESKILKTDEILKLYEKINNKQLKNPYDVIYNLKKEGVITSISKDKYILKQQKEYIINTNSETKKIYDEFKKEYPDINIVVWETDFLSDFMLHQIYNNIIIVEVPKYAMEIAYTKILDNFGKKYTVLTSNVYSKDYMNYQINKVLIIKPLINNAPLVVTHKYYVPKVEKLLIDLYKDKIYYAYQGHELNIIFENAFSKHDVNLTTLFTYAKRRGIKKEVKEYLRKINIDERYKENDKYNNIN